MFHLFQHILISGRNWLNPSEVAPEVDAFASVDPLRHLDLDRFAERSTGDPRLIQVIGNFQGGTHSEMGNQHFEGPLL